MSLEHLPRMRTWTLYTGILATLAAIAIFATLAYRSIERDLTASAVSGRASIAYLAAATMSEEFKRLVDVGRSLATRVRFRQLLAEGKWQEAGAIMNTVTRDFDVVDRVLLVDPRGLVKAELPAAHYAHDADLSYRDWYRGVILNWQPYVSSSFPDPADAQHLDFALALPVFDGKNQPLAILVLRARIDRFFDWVHGLQLDRDGSIVIVDRETHRAYDSAMPGASEVVTFTDSSIVKQVLNGQSGVAFDVASEVATGAENTKYVAAFSPVLYGWGVIARWPQETVFAARDAQLRSMLLVSVLIMVMASAALFLLMKLSVERRRSELDRLLNVELERHVADRTAQLAQMNVELESFSYSISHDLRAPLRAIDGYSQMLADEHHATATENGKRLVDNIHRNVSRMAQLIDELLEFSRLNRVALNCQLIDMNAMVRDVNAATVAANAHTHTAPVAINLTRLPAACGDPALLRQVWTNIIDNAVKYTSHSANACIEVSGEVRNGQVVYCTSDNGAGFDMNYYDRLFKPFSRLHSPGEFSGTGVGLAIVKRIVERHDGRVWAESAPGKGTKVYFSLPEVEMV